MARMPHRPPDLMAVLDDTAELLRERGMDDLAGDVEAVHAALTSMLQITRFGDCLFADEVRNILNIRHNMPARRGGASDPMLSHRMQVRFRRRK